MQFNQNLIGIGSEAFQTMKQDQEKQNDGSDNRILLEILSRLPVKSLLRFMCVCKRWKSLISSRTLRKLHRERHSSSLPLILTLHSSEEMGTCEEEFQPGMIPDYYLTTFDLYGNVLQCRTLPIFTECLSLLSIPPHAKLLFFRDSIGNNNFFYNPSTRQIFPFSLPNLIKPRSLCYGYIPSKDEYVITILWERNSPKPWVCETVTISISDDDNFMLHYNEWRSIDVTTMIKSVPVCLFVSGAFYWLVTLAGDEDKQQSILSFDVETNVFSTFALPQGLENHCFELFELDDELYFTNLTLNYTTLEVWKFGINDKKKLWTLYWKIDFRDIGYTGIPKREYFELEVMLWRLKYLNLDSSKLSRETGRLVFLLEHMDLKEDEEGKLKPLGEDIMRALIEKEYGSLSEYYMFYSSVRIIHSNLFTL